MWRARKRSAPPASSGDCNAGGLQTTASGGTEGLRSLLWLRCLSRRWLRLSSPCEGAACHRITLGADGAWHGFCPVCKRPIEAECALPPLKAARGAPKARGCAYVVALWGSSPGYVLGAMVLARSLRTVGARHELVLLHTANVPADALRLLSQAGWKPQAVEAVQGVSELYNHGEPRFQGVFTKLRALGLLEYAKVLCLDIDTLALGSMDELFELPAPAANARGPQDDYRHGDGIDGSCFFLGGTGTRKSWGQCWGINAGVMLLRPSEADLQQTLLEVLDPRHPSHVQGNGPEQDYLSRYWADSWTHIGVEYNFQLHQMYHVLHPRGFQDARLQLMQRFVADPSRSGIHLVHYSGALKPWSRVLDEEYASDPGPQCDERFLRATLESFNGYWLWVLRDEEAVRQQGPREGIALGADGRLHWLAGEALGAEVEIPECRAHAAEALVAHSLRRWQEAYRALEAELGSPGLAREVARACETASGSAKPKVGDSSLGLSGWRCSGGWWLEQPVLQQASALAGCVPEPFVTFSVRCHALVHEHGALALGVRLLAVPAEGCSIEPSDGDLARWAASVPPGALVFAAFVRAAQEATAAALSALAAAGVGAVPTAPSLLGCEVFVLVGRGGQEACHTMAAADVALASLGCEGDAGAGGGG